MQYLAICGKSGARHVRVWAQICQPNPAGAARGTDCQARAGLPQRPVSWLGPALGLRGFTFAGSCLRLLQMPCLMPVRARGHSICLYKVGRPSLISWKVHAGQPLSRWGSATLQESCCLRCACLHTSASWLLRPAPHAWNGPTGWRLARQTGRQRCGATGLHLSGIDGR